MQQLFNIWGQRYDPADLPTWRKIVAVGAVLSGFAMLVLTGSLIVPEEAYIYRSAPPSAVEKRGEVYPVYVEHGYLRYITREEAVKLAVLRHNTDIAALLLVTGVMVIVTYRQRRL